MTHDWSHLVDAVWQNGRGHITKEDGENAVSEVLFALTPSDLAALIAEKCPGWVTVKINETDAMAISGAEAIAENYNRGETWQAKYCWTAMLSAAPKLGEDN